MKKRILLKTNLLIFAIIILGFMCISIHNYQYNRKIFRHDMEHVAILTAEGIYNQIDSIFTKPINISLTMANDNLLKDFLAREDLMANDTVFLKTIKNYLLAYKEKYKYDSVFLVSTKTSRYYHFEGINRILTPDNPENTWYYSFLKAPDEYALNIDNDEAAQNEIVIFINCKIKNRAGAVIGVVGVGFRVDYLQKIFKEYETKFDVKAFLIDDQGMIEISTDETGYRKMDLFKQSDFSALRKEIFQAETGKLYENIYEIDITHNRAASEATEAYFESLGVPRNTPYDDALRIIAQKQIKAEYRQGYLAAFSPENILRVYQEGGNCLRYDFMISNNAGCSYYWMRITARIFYWEEDDSVRMFVYRQNIDSEKCHERRLVERMQKDSLTGLYNKAATQERVRKGLAQAPEACFAFFILDVDKFKAVNDTLGHVAGDAVLIEFARVLKNRFREEDVVGRIGRCGCLCTVRMWTKRKNANNIWLKKWKAIP